MPRERVMKLNEYFSMSFTFLVKVTHALKDGNEFILKDPAHCLV